MEQRDPLSRFGWTRRLRRLISRCNSSAPRRGLPADAGSRLIDESETYLSGHYADWLTSQGRKVPAWAWINRLAHGCDDEIVELARPEGGTTNSASSSRISRDNSSALAHAPGLRCGLCSSQP
jgi:hypothetical protein